MLSFSLNSDFVDSYRSKPEEFGFNGLGNIVFYRTYSRIKENGEYETWVDVCKRVIDGMYSILQDHAKKNRRRWDANKAQKDAQEAFDRMFRFKWTPSGRGLWMTGTPFIHERKISEALLNCAFVSTENIKQEGGEIFEWLSNMLMLGVGVAFDTMGAGEVAVHSPKDSASTYLIDDSREGWARSIKVLINSYLDETDTALFDYSMIRLKGEAIKGFGGIASGPDPLFLCHNRIREYLDKNIGKKITSRTITDICNAIGACVVAGNVRRCLPYYANVQTSDGYKRIENIKEGDIVVTGGISNKVVAKIYSGEQQLIRINHRFGTLKCTPNHEIAIFNSLDQYEFKQASDIKAGDRLVFDKMGITNNNREIALPSFDSKHFNTKQEEKYPTILTEEIAWAIGAIQGDGTVSGDEISIYQEPKYINVLKEMNQVFLESFGRYSPIREHNDGYRWRISSAIISKWFNQHIKTSSTKLMVPEMIKTSSQMSRAAYLAGLLDTDGCVKRNSVICAVTTIYEDFARDIVSLLASLGIAAKVNHSQRITFNEKLVDAYDVTISGVTNKKRYDMLVGEFSVSDKLDKLSNYGHIDFSYPKSILKQDDMLGGYLSNWTDGVNYTHLNAKTSYLPTEVLSVELSDEIVPTYDIEVENVHQFTTDGIVVHNSAELALGDPDDKDYLSLKNYSLDENKYRADIGWASNNSVIGNNVDNYYNIAENIHNNAEPGVVWLDNIQKYGRMGEEKIDNAVGVNPCSEIPLASREMCNLAELYMHNMEDEYDFQRTIKFAYLYSKAITLTYEWISDPKSRKIMMKNRRVGVGTTAIAQFLAKHSVNELVKWWDNGYKLIQSYDKRYSQWLGIPESIRTTTIKPSGTVSLLAGATPGIHYPHDNYYIRRVRIQNDTPMLTALQYAGYHIEADAYSENTSVVEIPICIYGKTLKSKTMWEQLQLATLAQRYWADNSVSVTISFYPSDVTVDEISNAIALYAGELKCVSMLPVTEDGQYAQMPYESITSQQYHDTMENITKIPNLAEYMSAINKLKDLYCENDSCAIK